MSGRVCFVFAVWQLEVTCQSRAVETIKGPGVHPVLVWRKEQFSWAGLCNAIISTRRMVAAATPAFFSSPEQILRGRQGELWAGSVDSLQKGKVTMAGR